MLSESLEAKINAQINAELYSSYLYLSMSAHFLTQNLPGFANWMRVQAQEELFHATKFFDYVNERGGRVELTAIDGPQVEWESPIAVFEHIASHEHKVTGLINGLVSAAMAENDFAANTFLQWFVTEQVEEEASANEVLQSLRIIGGDGAGLLMIDRELAQRVFVPPAAGSAT